MVSTRQHPREFPAPEASPVKSSPRKSLRNPTASPSPEFSGVLNLAKRAVSNSIDMSTTSTGWSHTASNVTLAWLLISVPLQVWDTLYIFGRPHTMAGGFLQWPIWKPYEIYAAIDHVYGWPGWNNGDGFGGAQAALNGVETLLYGLYLMIVLKQGVPSAGGRGVQNSGGTKGWLSGGRRVAGKSGNKAVLIGFAAAVMTLSKTVLYYFNEYFSSFENIKHNSWPTLILFYGVMNGLWVIFPAYMVNIFGADILEALDLASESSSAAAKKTY